MSDADKVVALIEQHGLTGLCGMDGCWCISFELHRICVDISCRKSSSGDGPCARVYSHSLDYYEPMSGPEGAASLRLVMTAVIRGLGDEGHKYRQIFEPWKRATDSEGAGPLTCIK